MRRAATGHAQEPREFRCNGDPAQEDPLEEEAVEAGWRLVYEDVPCQRRPLDEATWQFLKLRLPLHASICVYMFMYSCTVLIHKVHD